MRLATSSNIFFFYLRKCTANISVIIAFSAVAEIGGNGESLE